MRNSRIFAALLLLLSACTPAAAPDGGDNARDTGRELVSSSACCRSRLSPSTGPKLRRRRTRRRTGPISCSCRTMRPVEQLTSNSWVDQTHVRQKVDRPEPDKDGCRRGQNGKTRSFCGRPRARRFADGRSHRAAARRRRRTEDEAAARTPLRPPHALGESCFDRLPAAGQHTCSAPVVPLARGRTGDIVLRSPPKSGPDPRPGRRLHWRGDHAVS